MARSDAKLINHKKVKKSLRTHDKRVNKEAKQAVRSGLLLIQNAAKTKAPVKTGNLARSITNEVIEYDREIDGRVGTDQVGYAADVEFGTNPYVIRAKNAKVLSDGNTVFGKRVQHPGIKAQPYLRPAFDENRDRALQEIDDVLEKLTRKWRR